METPWTDDKTEYISFKISGEFVTEQARTFVIEDRWEDGLHLLKDCIVESNYDIAVSVITGQQKFEGINTLELVEEDPQITEEWKHKFGFHFCGIYREGSLYWRPYAYVDGWCAKDLDRRSMTANRYCSFDGPAPTRMSSKFTIWVNARNNFYMSDPFEDKAMMGEVSGYPVTVLWAQVRVPPPWVTVHRSTQAAIDEFVQYRWLEHRGAHQYKDEIAVKEPPQPSDEAKAAREKFEQEQEELYQKQYAEVVLKIHEHCLDTGCGWLSPEGQLIPCAFSDHDFYALVILQEFYQKKDCGMLTRGDALIQLGWVKLQNKEWWLHYHDYLVTQTQYDVIWDYSQKNNLSMPEGLEVK